LMLPQIAQSRSALNGQEIPCYPQQAAIKSNQVGNSGCLSAGRGVPEQFTTPAVFLSALHVAASHVRCQFIFINTKNPPSPENLCRKATLVSETSDSADKQFRALQWVFSPAIPTFRAVIHSSQTKHINFYSQSYSHSPKTGCGYYVFPICE
jgi:hypothetical protein